jgi:hypothetical protein
MTIGSRFRVDGTRKQRPAQPWAAASGAEEKPKGSGWRRERRATWGGRRGTGDKGRERRVDMGRATWGGNGGSGLKRNVTDSGSGCRGRRQRRGQREEATRARTPHGAAMFSPPGSPAGSQRFPTMCVSRSSASTVRSRTNEPLGAPRVPIREGRFANEETAGPDCADVASVVRRAQPLSWPTGSAAEPRPPGRNREH